MHHYWRAWNPVGFMTPGPDDERKKYGEAVPLGYQVCDRLLGKFIRLMDDDTVLVICSSMGQQPFVNAAYRDGKVIVRLKDVERFLAAIAAEGVTEIVPTMVPQINLRIPDPAQRQLVGERIMNAVRHVSGRTEKAMAVAETGELLTVTPLGLAQRAANITYQFPGIAPVFPMEDLFTMDAPTVKQGMHHPDGIFIAYGKGICAGRQLGPCTNLDIAPTILSLMGIAVPPLMSGRVLVTPS
jgi:arylsulfatase A-like enzyme